MIRALEIIMAIAGPLAIITLAWMFLTGTVPRAHGAEPCAGSWVLVSYYGAESGNRTASGMRFDGTQLLAAHKFLPFHTRVRFTYRGRSIVVPIEDRGPYVKGRTFDLSKAAAQRIGMVPAGVGRVCAERIR
jgi:rare lipoprotein A (peptidoglycan hydrolase)